MRHIAIVLCTLPLVFAGMSPDEAASQPSIRDVLSVPQAGDPQMAPDGSAVVFTIRTTDWDSNRFDTEIYIAPNGKAPVRLTDNPAGSSTDPKWLPDSQSIAFFADRGEGTQIYVLPVTGGTPEAVTAWPGGLLGFEVSPDGRHMALLLGAPPDPKFGVRQEQYGKFEIIDEAKPAVHLWLLDIATARAEGGASPGVTKALRPLTTGPDNSVTVFSEAGIRQSYAFSPDGEEIVYSHAASPLIMDSIRSNISIVNVTTGDTRQIIKSDSWDETPTFSPDGQQVLFGRTVLEDWLADKQMMIVSARGGKAKALDIDLGPKAIDTQPLLIGWGPRGIDAFFLEGTKQHIHRIDPKSGKAVRLGPAPDGIKAATFSADGRQLALVATDAEIGLEVYRSSVGEEASLTMLSSTSQAMTDWPRHQTEIIRWAAADGVEIEGILYHPEKLSRSSKAPLIIVLHGGPRDAEKPSRLHNKEYPVEQWLSDGARVLFPNYRGSTGYGGAFRKLTWQNIGHAETKDIVAAINHLTRVGIVDPDLVGVAGHSWGGYLSAFLSTSTNRFKVASAGSAITNNRVNYVLSNAGVAEEGYLNSLPWKEPELWESTSPMSYVAQARTPTLIQHGAKDVVVPVANAYELYRALSDMNVPVQFALFPESGHNISRPKEKLAWMLQNHNWFSRYLWDDVVPLPWD